MLIAALLLLPFASCRTTRPSGSAIAPLTATTPAEALQQLRERREHFQGLHSLMRVRTTTDGRTQSFRAQLSVLDANRMELLVYTPLGTTALKLTADGDDIRISNRIESSEWEGSVYDLARSLGFLRTALKPAEMAMLLAGLPPRDDLTYEVDPAGLRRAATADVVATFDPPAYPAKHVVVTRGNDRIEIDHLEVVE
jgi:hypothetical protein